MCTVSLPSDKVLSFVVYNSICSLLLDIQTLYFDWLSQVVNKRHVVYYCTLTSHCLQIKETIKL